MRPHDLATILLRVMAVWFLCSAVGAIPAIAHGVTRLFMGAGGVSGYDGLPVAVGLPLVASAVQITLAFALFVGAPAVARLILRDAEPDAAPIRARSVGAGDAYRIAALLMGIYILTRAIGPAARATVELMAQGPYSATSRTTIAQMVEAGGLAVCGAALAFGARGLAKFLSSLGYDSENTPAQQFSLRLLLIFVVGFAVLLGIIRALVR